MDENKGVIIEEECQDTNPGTFHVILTNKLKRQESFVFDATYDFEVWNQPVTSYSVRFFNPRTYTKVSASGSVKKQINRAIVNKSSFTNDKFKNFRSLKAKTIVGVVNTVRYISETDPKQGKPYRDDVVSVDYIYDLELDSEGKIVGGEWYSNRHPDFIWTNRAGARPLTNIDKFLAERSLSYDGRPDSLKKIIEFGKDGKSVAQLSSAGFNGESPTPLAAVIDGLLKIASTEDM